MTTYDLMMKIKDILEANGYETKSPIFANVREYEVQYHASKDGKYYETKHEYMSPWGLTQLTSFHGYKILVECVYRSNGTSENVSVDIQIYKVEDSSGRRVAKERVNTHMSDKSIFNRVKKIMDIYETL